MAVILAGCASYDPHPASADTPGDPDHPPSTTITGTTSEPTPPPSSVGLQSASRDRVDNTYLEPSK